MSRAQDPLRWSPRVYLLLAVCALVLFAVEAPAQPDLTASPFMTKGPAGAPVTIIEFSDYQ